MSQVKKAKEEEIKASKNEIQLKLEEQAEKLRLVTAIPLKIVEFCFALLLYPWSIYCGLNMNVTASYIATFIVAWIQVQTSCIYSMKKVRSRQRSKKKNPKNPPRQPNHQHHQKQHSNHWQNLQRPTKIRTNPNSSEYIQRSLGTRPVDSHAVRRGRRHDSKNCEKKILNANR